MLKIVKKNMRCFVYLTSAFLFLSFSCGAMAGKEGATAEVLTSTSASLSSSSLSDAPSMAKVQRPLRSLVSTTTTVSSSLPTASAIPSSSSLSSTPRDSRSRVSRLSIPSSLTSPLSPLSVSSTTPSSRNSSSLSLSLSLSSPLSPAMTLSSSLNSSLTPSSPLLSSTTASAYEQLRFDLFKNARLPTPLPNGNKDTILLTCYVGLSGIGDYVHGRDFAKEIRMLFPQYRICVLFFINPLNRTAQKVLTDEKTDVDFPEPENIIPYFCDDFGLGLGLTGQEAQRFIDSEQELKTILKNDIVCHFDVSHCLSPAALKQILANIPNQIHSVTIGEIGSLQNRMDVAAKAEEKLPYSALSEASMGLPMNIELLAGGEYSRFLRSAFDCTTFYGIKIANYAYYLRTRAQRLDRIQDTIFKKMLLKEETAEQYLQTHHFMPGYLQHKRHATTFILSHAIRYAQDGKPLDFLLPKGVVDEKEIIEELGKIGYTDVIFVASHHQTDSISSGSSSSSSLSSQSITPSSSSLSSLSSIQRDDCLASSSADFSLSSASTALSSSSLSSTSFVHGNSVSGVSKPKIRIITSRIECDADYQSLYVISQDGAAASGDNTYSLVCSSGHLPYFTKDGSNGFIYSLLYMARKYPELVRYIVLTAAVNDGDIGDQIEGDFGTFYMYVEDCNIGYYRGDCCSETSPDFQSKRKIAEEIAELQRNSKLHNQWQTLRSEILRNYNYYNIFPTIVKTSLYIAQDNQNQLPLNVFSKRSQLLHPDFNSRFAQNGSIKSLVANRILTQEEAENLRYKQAFILCHPFYFDVLLKGKISKKTLFEFDFELLASLANMEKTNIDEWVELVASRSYMQKIIVPFFPSIVFVEPKIQEKLLMDYRDAEFQKNFTYSMYKIAQKSLSLKAQTYTFEKWESANKNYEQVRSKLMSLSLSKTSSTLAQPTGSYETTPPEFISHMAPASGSSSSSVRLFQRDSSISKLSSSLSVLNSSLSSASVSPLFPTTPKSVLGGKRRVGNIATEEDFEEGRGPNRIKTSLDQQEDDGILSSVGMISGNGDSPSIVPIATALREHTDLLYTEQ